jgi:hypothetical protein
LSQEKVYLNGTAYKVTDLLTDFGSFNTFESLNAYLLGQGLVNGSGEAMKSL